MAGVESAVTPQPVIKDVKTLKANLKEKEQEKRTRGDQEVEEILPNLDQQLEQDGGEQRKRRKVDDSDDCNKSLEIEEKVLDGPLPPTAKEADRPTDQCPPSSDVGAAASKEEAATSTAPSANQAESTEEVQVHPPKTVSTNGTSALSSQEEKRGQSDVDQSPPQPCQKPVDSNDQPNKMPEVAHEAQDAPKEVIPAVPTDQQNGVSNSAIPEKVASS